MGILERVPYRRVAPSRNVHGRQRYERYEQRENREITASESVIVQCIICGILIVAVLIITMVDIAPTQQLREGLRQALAGAHTVEELVTDVRNFSEIWLGTAEHLPEPMPEQTMPPSELPLSYGIPPIVIPPQATSPEYYYPMTSAPEASNPQNPGTSLAPGLWE